MIKKFFSSALLLMTGLFMAQEHKEEDNLPLKLHHAEPLYIDLIRDLGARKGESEWNLGMGVTRWNDYYEFTPLIEYEWAVADRLGLEIELPFDFFTSIDKDVRKAPGAKLEGLKLAMQYTFLVNKKYYTSMAVGYINELELNTFRDFGKKIIVGNVYNPFFVVAKGWGKDHSISTLLYTGPQFIHHFDNGHIETDWQVNTSIHYLIPNSKSFIGLEIDKTISKDKFNMVFRPQVRVALKDNVVLGLVTGIPTNTKHEGFSSFLRLIYEPKKK
ncbi:MAG: HAEPLYID family protein [Flavobacteriaceae bacterium]|nr:HAEPLYID family protein [Flavobacteriaceae bacterium]